jgi:hypothetical protein
VENLVEKIRRRRLALQESAASSVLHQVGARLTGRASFPGGASGGRSIQNTATRMTIAMRLK